MKTSDFDFELPEELIARHPAAQRDHSRLMLARRGDANSFSRHRFDAFPDLLEPDDLLAINDTRVFPARLVGTRAATGGRIEALLLRRQGDAHTWRALVRPARKVRPGDRIVFSPGRLEAQALAPAPAQSGERLLRFEWQGDWNAILEEVGHTPLPPYIRRARRLDHETDPDENTDDRRRYQTIYAARDESASVAAPTAGLHFTPAVFAALERRGVRLARLRLDVGPGTFLPVTADRLEDHPMHEEYIRVPADTMRLIEETRARGGRVVAVGTTVARALETVAHPDSAAFFRRDADDLLAGWTRLLIAPGYEFRAIDALLTNFHLPRSTLLALVAALAGRETVLAAYREAIASRFHFYSYGDCMLVL